MNCCTHLTLGKEIMQTYAAKHPGFAWWDHSPLCKQLLAKDALCTVISVHTVCIPEQTPTSDGWSSAGLWNTIRCQLRTSSHDGEETQHPPAQSPPPRDNCWLTEAASHGGLVGQLLVGQPFYFLKYHKFACITMPVISLFHHKQSLSSISQFFQIKPNHMKKPPVVLYRYWIFHAFPQL